MFASFVHSVFHSLFFFLSSFLPPFLFTFFPSDTLRFFSSQDFSRPSPKLQTLSAFVIPSLLLLLLLLSLPLRSFLFNLPRVYCFGPLRLEQTSFCPPYPSPTLSPSSLLLSILHHPLSLIHPLAHLLISHSLVVIATPSIHLNSLLLSFSYHP